MYKQKGFTIFTVISIIAFLILAFVLLLPQFFNLEKKQETEQCIKNMKAIRKAVKEYMDISQESFTGDIEELDRKIGVPVSLECPSNGVGDNYYVEGNYETGAITVKCPHVDEEEYKDHKLPETLKN